MFKWVAGTVTVDITFFPVPRFDTTTLLEAFLLAPDGFGHDQKDRSFGSSAAGYRLRASKPIKVIRSSNAWAKNQCR